MAATAQTCAAHGPRLALDIGGSLTKILLHIPDGAAGTEGRIVPEEYIEFFQANLSFHCARTSASFLFFIVPTADIDKTLGFLTAVRAMSKKTPVLHCTGGGAVKYRQDLTQRCGFSDVAQEDEVACIDGGIKFLSQMRVANEFYSIHSADRVQEGQPTQSEPSTEQQPDYSGFIAGQVKRVSSCIIRPYDVRSHNLLLMQVGSGISVLKLTPATVSRVDGSALGGATCFGLARALTLLADERASGSFQEVYSVAAASSSQEVDMLVGDIYGKEAGYANVLDADLLAASMGKVGPMDSGSVRASIGSMVSSVFRMISINAAHICILNCRLHSAPFALFCGSYIRNSPAIQKSIDWAIKFYSRGEITPVFVYHDAIVGVLGCFALACPVVLQASESAVCSATPIYSLDSFLCR